MRKILCRPVKLFVIKNPYTFSKKICPHLPTLTNYSTTAKMGRGYIILHDSFKRTCAWHGIDTAGLFVLLAAFVNILEAQILVGERHAPRFMDAFTKGVRRSRCKMLA